MIVGRLCYTLRIVTVPKCRVRHHSKQRSICEPCTSFQIISYNTTVHNDRKLNRKEITARTPRSGTGKGKDEGREEGGGFVVEERLTYMYLARTLHGDISLACKNGRQQHRSMRKFVRLYAEAGHGSRVVHTVLLPVLARSLLVVALP